MKKVFGLLLSSKLMGIVLLIFATSIAVATFIESKYSTSTAKVLVYNAGWFEGLLFLGIINITGIIIKKQLYKKEKLTIFLFHLAFVVILLGSAISRFFGYEGVMHIRNGNTENKILSDAPYLYASTIVDDHKVEKSKKVLFSALGNNYHAIEIENNGKTALIECTEITPNAVEAAKIIHNGMPMLEMQIAGFGQKQNIVLEHGKTKTIDGIPLSLNDSTTTEGINFSVNKDGLFIRSAFELMEVNMFDNSQTSLSANTLHPFKIKMLYAMQGLQLVATNFYPSAEITVTSAPDEQESSRPTALSFRVTVDNQSNNILYFAEENTFNSPETLSLGGIDITLGYSPRYIGLPFSLKLDDFVLEHYPGSMSPSWFESKITLIDSAKNLTQQHRIFMNNVLKYGGYRFYQSSYDSDEQGTILSVNHDFWGTFLTYIGYLLMGLGMLLSLLNNNSRFKLLSKKLTELNEIKKRLKTTFLIALLSLLPSMSLLSQSQLQDPKVIPAAQAELFGRLLVQDRGGRIKPMNSLSSELLRKISRKTSLMGQTCDQVLLGMLTFPEYWQEVPMIKVSNPDIRSVLNTGQTMLSFKDFFSADTDDQYILSKYVSIAYSKMPASRSKFDNDIIQLDERINLCYIIYTQEIFKIFPKPNDKSNTWYHPNNTENHFSGNDSIFASTILTSYLDKIREGVQTGNWLNNKAALDALMAFQTDYGQSIIPSNRKIKAELVYNKIDIFQKISLIYGLVGLALLILQFIGVFAPNFKLKTVSKIAFVILFASFLIHIIGLGLRWYISGHAPWSNGYESMIYIGFATMLASIVFHRKSAIVLSATAILTSIILFVAHLSWMDPEITNLVPVLKSYWLVIHVAVITASYGFLALGALTAFINLLLMIFQNEKNHAYTDITISELSIVIEMALTIGLYMLTIGTFLGGVWANESWGRYWGWDPKETWALVTVLWYALVTHLRMIPGFKGQLLFNIMALISFGTVIMTYFGVNYYLTGLHSYAKGDSAPLPSFVFKAIIAISVIIALAIANQILVLKKPMKKLKS